MAGRPPLRIGQHVKIVREHRGGGVWLARARFRDADGVTRRVQRSGPADEFDKYGKLAEDALLIALAERRPPVGPAATVKRDLVDPISLLIATGLRGLGRAGSRTDQVEQADRCRSDGAVAPARALREGASLRMGTPGWHSSSDFAWVCDFPGVIRAGHSDVPKALIDETVGDAH